MLKHLDLDDNWTSCWSRFLYFNTRWRPHASKVCVAFRGPSDDADQDQCSAGGGGQVAGGGAENVNISEHLEKRQREPKIGEHQIIKE